LRNPGNITLTSFSFSWGPEPRGKGGNSSEVQSREEYWRTENVQVKRRDSLDYDSTQRGLEGKLNFVNYFLINLTKNWEGRE